MSKKEAYHCPFTESCKYGMNLSEDHRYQPIKKLELDKPVFKDKEIKRSKYRCTALEKESVDCSWIQQLNMIDLSMAMSFTALKNTDCIAYALKMTVDEE